MNWADCLSHYSYVFVSRIGGSSIPTLKLVGDNKAPRIAYWVQYLARCAIGVLIFIVDVKKEAIVH